MRILKQKLAAHVRMWVALAIACSIFAFQPAALATTVSILPMGDQSGEAVPRPSMSPLGIPDEFYPIESLVANEEGHTILQIEVAENGWVKTVNIAGSSGFMRLDKAAMEIAKALWLFSPKTLLVKTTTDSFRVEVAWSLPLLAPDGNEASATADQAGLQSYPTAPGEMSPTGLFQGMSLDDYPPQSMRDNEQGRLVVRYLVKEDGNVGDAYVTKSSGYARLDNAAKLMIQRRWKYRPAMLRGMPLAVWRDANVVFRMPEPISWPRQCRSAPSLANQRVPSVSRNGSLVIRRQIFADEAGRILDALILTEKGWMRPIRRIRELDHVTGYDPQTLKDVQPTKCWLDSDFTIKSVRR